MRQFSNILTFKKVQSSCSEMVVVAKAATDLLHDASPRPDTWEFNDVFERQCGSVDSTKSNRQQGAGALIRDKGEPESLIFLQHHTLRSFALEAVVEDSASRSAHDATLSADMLSAERTGGGSEERKSVKWLPESELTRVQHFERVESITDEEIALLEKVKGLPHGIREFLLTKTDLVVQGSEGFRLALVPRQADCTLRLN